MSFSGIDWKENIFLRAGIPFELSIGSEIEHERGKSLSITQFPEVPEQCLAIPCAKKFLAHTPG
jgi:hypothetical protein